MSSSATNKQLLEQNTTARAADERGNTTQGEPKQGAKERSATDTSLCVSMSQVEYSNIVCDRKYNSKNSQVN